jgi:hypothetical protein
MRIVLSLLLSFVVCSLSFSQAPTADPELGVRPEAFSARTLGMGRTFLVGESGVAALFGNPATLTNQSGKWLIDVSADVSRVKETRSYPFYDSFEGVLGYNNYAINDHLYSKLDGGAAWLVPQHSLDALVLSAGSYSTYRFDYLYKEEVRNRFSNGGIQDLKLGENRMEVKGDLRSLSLGAAAREKKFSAGFGLSFLSGSWSYSRAVLFTENYPDGIDQSDQIDYETSGTPAEITFGGLYMLNDRLTLGARILAPAGKFKFDRDGVFVVGDSAVRAISTVEVTYPKRFSAGVQFRPQQEYRPVLALEGEYMTYSEVRDTYDDVFEIRAGAEQQVSPGTPIRLGFVYSNNPENKDRAQSLFTAGIGFHVQKLTGDLGVEIGKMSYENADLFPQSLYGDEDRTDTDKIETSLFRGLVTFRYAL